MGKAAAMTAIQKLRGVGPALAKVLVANGVDTVETLAAMEEVQLRSIPGIGATRAASLKTAAKAQAESSPDAENVRPAAHAVNGKAAGGQEADGQSMTTSEQAEMDAKLAVAEAARKAAEEKAAKAQAKARKAKRQAIQLAEEFAEAKEKAKLKARKVKAKAKKAIEKEKAKAKAILEGKAPEKKKKKSKK